MIAVTAVLPITASAADTVTYINWDDSNKEFVNADASAEKMTDDTDELADGGWYYVEGELTINDRITISNDNGTAHIILKDDAKLTASKGIAVSKNQSLFIYG